MAHNRWKLGQKGKDNGVLVTLALQERKYRIEVGYGLEGVLPDSLVGSLGRELLVPAFRAGDYGGGLAALAGELADAHRGGLRGGAVGGPAGRGAAPAGVAAGGKPGPLATGLALLLIPIFIYLLIRHPQLLVMHAALLARRLPRLLGRRRGRLRRGGRRRLRRRRLVGLLVTSAPDAAGLAART